MLSKEEQELAIGKLIELVRFPTVSASAPLDCSYDACAAWLVQQLSHIGLEAFILPESVPHKPIVVGVWKGSHGDHLPCVVLNSHYDVVPVILEHWNVPAFEGLVRDNRIYGRGTQDMKCVCAQYLVALEKLKKTGFVPKRTIVVTYVPDEEIGGIDGMNVLLNSPWFKQQRIGVALDEGLANTSDVFSVFYGERLPWWVHVSATGSTGHGSRFIEGNAVAQVIQVCNKALAYREAQRILLHGEDNEHVACSHAVAKKKELTLGDVTTINVTMLRAGVQAAGKDIINVIPPQAEAGFDIRISPHVDPKEIAGMLDSWCAEVNQVYAPHLTANQGVTWKFFYEPLKEHAVTQTDASNPWWGIFSSLIKEKFHVDVVPQVFPAATDSRFLRAMGVNAFGFSPMRNCPILLHEHNENIEEKVYLEGCEVYLKLIPALAMASQLAHELD